MSTRQHAGDYKLESIIVTSHSHDVPIDITAHVDEFEIFENINSQHLTGSFLMKDDMRFYDGIGINGTETIDITIESPVNENFVTKRFSLQEVTSAVKTTDNTEILAIKIIENRCFNNNLMLINKAYTGTPDNIIQKILKDNLNLDVDLPLIKPFQKSLKVVIPNMTPFSACQWILSMMSTDLGLPYFLFATVNDKNIQLKSLEEMFRTPACNKQFPYRFSQAYNQTASRINSDLNAFNVSAYTSMHKDNVFSLVASGATSGHRSISDMTSGQLIDYSFDVDTLFQQLLETALIDTDHVPVFTSRYIFNGKQMNEYNSFESHQVVANQTYNGISNIYEETSTGAYKLHACKSALLNMVMKTAINIRVPGIMYLSGYNGTIGRQIDFIYPANNTNIASKSSVSDEDTLDKKRSGTYVIYTARHHFKDTQHNIDMSCVKLGNRR